MSAAAALLVLLSAALHVAWNLVSKRRRPSAAFFLTAIATGAVLLTPVLVWHAARVPDLLPRLAPILLATGLCSTVYNVSLAAAYRAADLSLVYPLARSLAPALVAVVSAGLGRGDAIGWGCWAGIAAIAVGNALLPLERLRDARRGAYLAPGFLLAGLTAAAIAGYTLVDDAGVRTVRAAADLPPLQAGFLYGAFHAWTTALCLGAFVLATAGGRRELRAERKAGLRTAAWVGVTSYAAYILVLTAMTLVADVSYVAAFRQAGVPLSVLAGAGWLGERLGGLRLAGVGVVSAGLVLVALR